MWATKLENIGEIHFDLTNLCNAECPECSRTKTPEGIKDKAVLDYGRFSDWFREEEMTGLRKINLCGSFGDPLTHPELFKILDYFSSWQNYVKVNIATNGGLKTKSVWKRLAEYDNVQVMFGIDGLEDTNDIYRVKVKWKKLQENFREFIANGGHAIWQFIAFPWNEHQVDAARERAIEEGFRDFRLIKSHRIDHKAEEYGKKDFKNKDLIPQHDEQERIVCEVQEEYTSVFVVSNGLVYPCCFIGSHWVNSDQKLLDWYRMAGGQESLNLYKHSLRDIVEGEFFSIVQDSFDIDEDDPLGACSICIKTCKKRTQRDFIDVERIT